MRVTNVSDNILFLSLLDKVDVPFRKIENQQCPVAAIKEFSGKYLGTGGFEQATRDCAADDTCKAIVDVSEVFGYPPNVEGNLLSKLFLLCTADEMVDSWDDTWGGVDTYIKGDF